VALVIIGCVEWAAMRAYLAESQKRVRMIIPEYLDFERLRGSGRETGLVERRGRDSLTAVLLPYPVRSNSLNDTLTICEIKQSYAYDEPRWALTLPQNRHKLRRGILPSVD
jgi:hypothetical protein